MTADASEVSAAPSGPEELWRDYRPLCRHIVSRSHIPFQDVDDVTNNIMTRLIESDIIGMFDPDYYIEHGGKVIAAKFRSFFTAQVQLRVKGQRDKLGRLGSHETLLCDQPVTAEGVSWIEMFGGQWWDDYSDLDADEFLSRMRTWLAFVPPRSDQDRCDLLALFDEVTGEARAEGRIDYARIQDRFGIGYTTARGWVARLRELLSAARESLPPVSAFEISGVPLTALQLRSAINILRSCMSTAVRQPLAKAGHPLASAADPRWYHPFSQEEIAEFPDLKTPRGTKQKHFGHVKTAVLHRLERMLAEVAPTSWLPDLEPEVIAPTPVAPEPEPVSPLDEIESELWKLGADPLVVDRILALAERHREESLCPAA